MKEKLLNLKQKLVKFINYLFESTFNNKVFNILVAVFVPTLFFMLINIKSVVGLIVFILIVLLLTFVYNNLHYKLDNKPINKIFRFIFGLQFFVFSIGKVIGYFSNTETPLGSLASFALFTFVLLGFTYLPEAFNKLLKRKNTVSYRIYLYVMLTFILAVSTFYELQSFLGFADHFEYYILVNYAYLMITIDVVFDLFKEKWKERGQKHIKNKTAK